MCVRAPAIGIFFHIFVGEHRFKGSPSMIQVQGILDQDPIDRPRCDEEFVHPLTYSLAHPDFFAWWRSRMPSDNDTHLGYPLVEVKPASIKQLNDFASAQSSHACAWWMSEHALELGPLEHPIRSPPRDQVDPCLYKLSNHNRIAVLPLETNQSCLWWQSEVREARS